MALTTIYRGVKSSKYSNISSGEIHFIATTDGKLYHTGTMDRGQEIISGMASIVVYDQEAEYLSEVSTKGLSASGVTKKK